MPSPSSQRQMIIDAIIHRLQNFANAIVTDSIFKYMTPDGVVLNENTIYIAAGQEEAQEAEYGSVRIKNMLVTMTLIIAKADNPEREFEALLKQVRDIIEREPELKTDSSDATTARCIQMTELSLTQPQYDELFYTGTVVWNCKYQYSAASA